MIHARILETVFLFFCQAFEEYPVYAVFIPDLFLVQKSLNEIAPVSGFNQDRYLGKWYEVARLPNSFQKNMVDCTAEYVQISEKKIAVMNSGYHILKEKRSFAGGKAKFVGETDRVLLKVSFFRSVQNHGTG